MSGPLIPIKHADGTIEKITLDEFKVRQKKSSSSGNVSVVTTPSTNDSVIKSVFKENDNKKNVRIDKPIVMSSEKNIDDYMVKPSSEDNRSLLEEELPTAKTSMANTSISRLSEAEEIFQSLNLSLSAEVKKRLIGLVQLRLKDVRGDAEIKQWLILPENQMGIGLDEAKAEMIVNTIKQKIKKNSLNSETTNVKPLKVPLGTPSALMKEIGEPLPAVSSPINSFVHSPINNTSAVSDGKKMIDNLIVNEMKHNTGGSIEDLIVEKKPTNQTGRPIVQDITPVKMTHLGPVDEIKFFTLIDFRRLSANPEEAVARLYQKFINLKEESYLLYMEALDAWRHSPLFMDYTNKAIMAINQKNKLENVLNDDSIKLSEIMALIKMQKMLL